MGSLAIRGRLHRDGIAAMDFRHGRRDVVRRRQLIESFVKYYNVDSTNIGVGKDSACGPNVQRRQPPRLNAVTTTPR